MRYVLRTFFGFGLLVFANASIGYAIYKMLQVGTCASGGPYVVAQECPSGTAALGWTVPVAILLLFAGGGLYAGRGKAPGSDNPPHSGLVVIWFWTGLFWSIAAGAFLGVWGPDAHPGPGAKEGGLIVAFLFVPMGAGGLLFLPRDKRLDSERPADVRRFQGVVPGIDKASKAFATHMPGLDPIDRLERLERLRNSGAINQREFERLKQQVMGET